MSMGGERTGRGRGNWVLYHVKYPMINVMYLSPPSPEQTDACENFTLPQLRSHAITNIDKKISYKLIVTTIIETKSILTSIVDNVFFSFQTEMEVVGSSGKYR